ncbi:MAG TPA: PilN domain-containing protein [Planctomycetaceae bacterium]|nr:PilN domain-containing protein [Planctomycetaceae bacterium]
MNDHLNLLPVAVRRRNRFWLRLRQWSAIWMTVATACVVGTLVQVSRVAAERYRLLKLAEAVKPLRTTQQELDANQTRLKILRSRESLLAMLDRMEQPVQLLGIVGHSVGGDRQEVQVYDLMIMPTQVVQTIKASEAAATPTGTTLPTTRTVERAQLKIDGFGVDDLAVARFVAGLREAGVFETVALRSSVHVTSLPGECRQFTVECVFQ